MSKKKADRRVLNAGTAKTCIQISVFNTNGEVSTSTMASTFRLGHLLHRKGIGYRFIFMDDPDAFYNLNKLANAAYKDKRISHFLLIGSNVAFDPDLVTRLIDEQTDFACIRIPSREVDLRALHHEVAALELKPPFPDNEECLAEGFQLIETADLGFALVHRRVLEKMVEKSAAPKFIDAEAFDEEDKFRPPPEVVNGFFSPIYHQSTRDQLHLYDAFCYKWRELCRGEIRLYESPSLVLRGLMMSRARYADGMTS